VSAMSAILDIAPCRLWASSGHDRLGRRPLGTTGCAIAPRLSSNLTRWSN